MAGTAEAPQKLEPGRRGCAGPSIVKEWRRGPVGCAILPTRMMKGRAACRSRLAAAPISRLVRCTFTGRTDFLLDRFSPQSPLKEGAKRDPSDQRRAATGPGCLAGWHTPCNDKFGTDGGAVTDTLFRTSACGQSGLRMTLGGPTSTSHCVGYCSSHLARTFRGHDEDRRQDQSEPTQCIEGGCGNYDWRVWLAGHASRVGRRIGQAGKGGSQGRLHSPDRLRFGRHGLGAWHRQEIRHQDHTEQGGVVARRARQAGQWGTGRGALPAWRCSRSTWLSEPVARTSPVCLRTSGE